MPDAEKTNLNKLTAPSKDGSAYLVLHRGAKWTDVYRLLPEATAGGGDAFLGRASENQIVLRSGRVSRRHARFFWQDEPQGAWLIEDLGSRNGVRLNNSAIQAPTPLVDGDRIEVAGFEIEFTYDLGRTSLNAGGQEFASDDEDQRTRDNFSDVFAVGGEGKSECLDVVSRSSGDLLASTSQRRPGGRGNSEVVHPPRNQGGGDSLDRTLLRMAFGMGQVDHRDQAVELLMQTMRQQIPEAEIGVYIDLPDRLAGGLDTGFDSVRSRESLPPPKYVHQRPGRRYRRPPETLLGQVVAPGGVSVLARNVLGDSGLATENTQGEVDVESIILTPIPDAKSSESAAQGLIHITASPSDRCLTDVDLSLVVTASEIFSEANRSLRRHESLKDRLKASSQTIQKLRRQLSGHVDLLGSSDAIGEVQIQIARVADSGSAVLLRGESGTGKELVAAAIHHASSRAAQPMICLNCAALSKDLLESELFGHEQGAFTGATAQKRGKFEVASGGTLMLDEIGEMNVDLQAKLLRVLEGHPFERVGGQTPIRVDVRIIAATHRDLQAMVDQGTFRQDLFYRLNVVEIIVPPLRDRGQDIVRLATHFVKTLTRSMGRAELVLTPAAVKKLLAYRWPGNVRELKNVIERAVVMSPRELIDGSSSTVSSIDADDLMLAPAGRGVSKQTEQQNHPTAMVSLAELEKRHIEQVLASTGGNKSQASSILGIERSTLDRKLKKYAKEKGQDQAVK